MLNSRTYHRRASARPMNDDTGASPSILESLVSTLTDYLARSALRRVTHGVHEIVRQTVLQLTLGWIGAAGLTGGVFLLLGAGVKGLEALRWPLWLACLSVGAFAVLVALLTMKGILWPRKREEGD